MKSSEFIHLHNHSEYSLLDGMLKITDEDGKPSEFLKGLLQKNVKALAITDHGNMYGAADFYFSARECGVHPIIGCEAYLAPGSRKDKNEQRANGHITLLAQDFEGYQNLMALISEAYLDGYYYDPRIDRELLAKYSKGIIALSGCLKSHVAQSCFAGDIDKACALASEYRDILGAGNYYIELMDHGIPEEQKAMPGLIEVSKRTGIPLVATNDCHYLRKEDWQAHDIHLCISTGSTLDDPDRLRMTTHELYFKTADEMKKLFSHTPQSISNTVEIAMRCNVELPQGKFIIPVFQLPPEHKNLTEAQYLEKLCAEGLRKKMGGEIPEAYAQRMREELKTILDMGFPGYFLIVSDFINYARSQGIPVGPGRGSGAGAIVAYALDITRVDPIVNGLLFERFLNPGRKSMPDLDIDFSDEGRAQVIEYVRQKYGTSNVAQIITFGTIKAKLAIKDVARVMGMPPQEANAITKHIPGDLNIYRALAEVPELQKLSHDPKIKKVLDAALKIEGLKRHTGVHAAGTVVTKEAVTRYTPLARGSREVVTTQYEGRTLDRLGLLKIDFLGLRTLTIIDKTVTLVAKTRGINIDIQKIPMDDSKTFDLLRAGQTTCVFQLESKGMKELVRALKPSQFSDISALVALYRPGPMKSGMHDEFVARKHGRKKITYDHSSLEPILKETYGTMIYQEQVMNISKALAGFSPAQADDLRKAMGKKIAEKMEKAKNDFMTGCETNKIPGKIAAKIFGQMAEFAAYGFNKSHSVAYALVSYQTAYLKANFPVEFMTSALTSEIGHNAIGSEEKENKIVTYKNEALEMGIAVRGPDVQHSDIDFSAEGVEEGKKAIRFGLQAVKNVGYEAAKSIIAARESGGPFKSLEDLCMRVDLRQANKKTFESLIKAGALDSLMPKLPPEKSRAALLTAMEKTLSRMGKVKEELASQQDSLFGGGLEMSFQSDTEESTPAEPLHEHTLLSYEKEVLGFFLSGHPLAKLERQLKMASDCSIDDVLQGKAMGPVRRGGTYRQGAEAPVQENKGTLGAV